MARYALVVGISEYKSKHLKNLSKPEQDAEAIASLLEDYGDCERVEVLKGYVSAEKLEAALTALITERAVRNEVIIYFTGHGFSTQGFGGKKGHLATSDCEIEMDAGKPKRQSRAIAFSDLNDLLQSSNLSNLIMLLDACHSGELVERATIEKSLSAFNTQQDYCLIAACRGFEEAWAKKSDKHSVFTEALLDALHPENADLSDGCITSDLLVEHLRRALKGSRQELVRYGRGRSLPIVRFPTYESPDQIHTLTISEVVSNATQISRVPLQMPPLPSHFVERPFHQNAIKEILLAEEGKGIGTLIVSAIHGLGGIGKSVLASKLAHDDAVQTRFSDGVLWVTLGQSPDILPLLSGWIQALGDYDYRPTAIQSASNHLRTLLFRKRVLLVVDDVWNPHHLEPFRVGGSASRVLVTTREVKIADARRYDLDVMNTSQSIELITQKLSYPLSPSARKLARIFAGRVSYLPLALELATSQVEEGVTWEELIDNFNKEVACLEALDVHHSDNNLNLQQQRRYSLLACFNLSLKQLSDEQRHRFAWLGILPEDVSVTEAVVETIWQVSSSEAHMLLRLFKDKALISAGLKQADGKRSYRIHDLVHDFAQRMLTSPLEPKNRDELPGLGMTKAKAHDELLKRYRQKTQSGQWHTLQDDGYIYAHLTWHMEQAVQSQAIHQLIAADNELGRNGWYEACDAIGKFSGFVNDVSRAWRLATDECRQDACKGIPKLFRYAFIRASLNSLVSNVPIELLESLVSKKIWPTNKALAYAQQVQDPLRRATYVSTIVPYISEASFSDVLKVVGQMENPVYRAYVISRLAERSPSMWPSVLEEMREIEDWYDSYINYPKLESSDTDLLWNEFPRRVVALCSVVKRLPAQYLLEALTTVSRRQSVDGQKILTHLLSEHCPGELLLEVLEITRQIQDKHYRSSALTELATHLPELWLRVLKVARQIRNEHHQFDVLLELAKCCPEELLPGMLEVTCRIESESSRRFVLNRINRHLPELWSEVLEVVCRIQNDNCQFDILRGIAKHCPEDSWLEALEIVCQMQDEKHQSYALREIAKYCPKELWSKVLEAVRQIRNGEYLSYAFRGIAKHCPEDSWLEALEIVCQMQDEEHQSYAMKDMAKHCPKKLCLETLRTVGQIQDGWSKNHALHELSQHCPKQLWPEILEVVRHIKDGRECYECHQSNALEKIVKYCPKEFYPTILEIACQIQDEYDRSSTVHELAEYCPKELRLEVLELTRRIQNEHHRSGALYELAQHLPGLWPEVIEAVHQTQSGSAGHVILDKLKKYIPNKFLSEVLDTTRHIQDPWYRFSALCELAKHSLKELWPEVLETARQIEDESSLSKAFCELAKHCPKGLWPKMLKAIDQSPHQTYWSSISSELVKHCPEESLLEVLEMTRRIRDESSWSFVLDKLANSYPEELSSNLLEIACQFQSEYCLSSALCKLAKYCPEKFLSEVLESAYRVKDVHHHSEVLCELSKRNSTLWPTTLEAIRQIEDARQQSAALSMVAEYCLENSLSEVLEIARQLPTEPSRTEAICEIAKRMSGLWPEVLWGISICDEFSQSEILCQIAKYCPEEFLSDVLERARQFQYKAPQSSVLFALAKRLPELWMETLETIFEISDQRTFSDMLWKVLKHGPEELLSELLEIARETPSEPVQSQTFCQLAKHLPELWPEALEMALHILDTLEDAFWIRSEVLCEMAEHCPDELLSEVLKAIRYKKWNGEQIDTLCQLAKRMPEIWLEVLNIVCKIQDKRSQSNAFQKLVKCCPEELSLEFLDAAHQIQDKCYYVDTLKAILPRMSRLPISFSQCAEILDALSYQKRSGLVRSLSDCITMASRFGDDKTASEVMLSVQSVCRQWL